LAGLRSSIRAVVQRSPFFSGCCNKNDSSPSEVQETIDLKINEAISLLGKVEDTIAVTTTEKDWRTYFASKLKGKGLEIGPLHRPMVTHSGMKMTYVDRCTVAELRAHYPELNELPLVEPQILDDAETLKTVSNESFDFIISAHVIEHMKNPLSALEQWARVVKPGGLIYMIVPDKRVTFDKKRVRTSIAHMVLDYKNPSDARDYEHYLDYAVHVHDKVEPNSAIEEANRLLETDYSIHYHVFIPEDVVAVLEWFSSNIRPLDIVQGPCRAPGSDEFHFLLRVPSIQ
jgi:predicted SAM-dependent methyltransferase